MKYLTTCVSTPHIVKLLLCCTTSTFNVRVNFKTNKCGSLKLCRNVSARRCETTLNKETTEKLTKHATTTTTVLLLRRARVLTQYRVGHFLWKYLRFWPLPPKYSCLLVSVLRLVYSIPIYLNLSHSLFLSLSVPLVSIPQAGWRQLCTFVAFLYNF